MITQVCQLKPQKSIYGYRQTFICTVFWGEIISASPKEKTIHITNSFYYTILHSLHKSALSSNPGHKILCKVSCIWTFKWKKTPLPSILSPSPSFTSCFFSSLFSWLAAPSCTSAKWAAGSGSVKWIIDWARLNKLACYCTPLLRKATVVNLQLSNDTIHISQPDRQMARL